MRNEIQDRLVLAQSVAADPATIFCVEPFNSLDGEGSERMGKLLTRVIRNPDRALVVATRDSLVFAFADQILPTESEGIESLQTEDPPSAA
jgi:ABC-type lipoprotein export system ATPase subunit